MATIDPEQERRRFSEFYAYQMDPELEKVASQADDLTDLAREMLRAEMARRGLATALAGQAGAVSPQDDAGTRGMVTIRQFRDLPEALFAKGSLESSGIECALIDDNMVRLDWFISNLLGGVKLQVRPEDAAVAEEILSQPIPESFDVPGIGEYKQPHCPKCQSLDVNFQEVAPAAYLSAAVSVPFPFHRRAWRCHACDAEWEDDGDDAAEADSRS
jgi:hypothetical protein